MQQTQSQGFTLPVEAAGSFSGAVSFSCAGPSGVSITCSGPVNVSPSGGANASFSVNPGSSGVSGTVTVTATSGTLLHKAIFTLSVAAAPPPPAITFSGSSTVTVAPGGTGSFAMVVTGINGWTSPVTIHTFPASLSADFCTVINNSCITDHLNGNDITVTPPATIHFQVTDRTNKAGQSATYQPTLNDVTVTGVVFTLITAGSATPSYTLTVPTQITVPATGTLTTKINVSSQNSYTGTVAISTNSAAATPGMTSAPLSTSNPSQDIDLQVNGASLQDGVSTVTVTAGADTAYLTVTKDGGTLSGPAATIHPETSSELTYTDSVPRRYHYYCYSSSGGGCNNLPPTSCDAGDPNVLAKPFYYAGSQFLIEYTALPGAILGNHSIRCIVGNTTIQGTTLTVKDASQAPTITSVCYGGVLTAPCAEPSFAPGTGGSITINGQNLVDPNSTTRPSVSIGIAGQNTKIYASVTSASSTRIDATVNVYAVVSPGEYDVTVFPFGIPTTYTLNILGAGGYLQSGKVNSNSGKMNVGQSCANPSVLINSIGSNGQKVVLTQAAGSGVYSASTGYSPSIWGGQLTVTASPSGGTLSWSLNDYNLAQFVTMTGSSSTATGSSVYFQLKELADSELGVAGRVARITVTYTPPACGPVQPTSVSDSFQIALTEDVTRILYVDRPKTRADGDSPSSPSYVVNATNTLSMFDPVYQTLNTPPLCAVALLDWSKAGSGSLFPSLLGVKITDGNERLYANYFFADGTANNATASHAPPTQIDTVTLLKGLGYYQIYNRFQAAYQIDSGGNIFAPQVLHGTSSAGLTLEPCSGFQFETIVGVFNFSQPGELHLNYDGVVDLSIDRKTFYRVAEGRVSDLGQAANSYINKRNGYASDATPVYQNYKDSVPYVWLVIEFDKSGRTIPASSGSPLDLVPGSTQFNTSVYSTELEYKRGSQQNGALLQIDIESFISLDFNYRFLRGK